jgi:hypothetical protein
LFFFTKCSSLPLLGNLAEPSKEAKHLLIFDEQMLGNLALLSLGRAKHVLIKDQQFKDEEFFDHHQILHTT